MENNEDEKVALAEVDEATAEEIEFDPSSFMDVEDIEVKGSKKEINSEEEEVKDEVETEVEEKVEEEAVEAVEEEEVEAVSEEDESYSDWDTLEDSEEVVSESEEATEEKVEVKEEEGKVDVWESFASDLGIEAENYEELVTKIKKSIGGDKTNKKIDFLKNMLNLDDEDLLRKELKADGYTDDEIEEEIDDLIDSGNLKRDARRLRKNLNRAIANEQSNIEKSESEAVAKQKAELEQARTGLKDYLSKTKDFFGGRVNEAQKEQHFKYITSGKFLNEIMNNHENLAKSAWLWRYKDKIFSNATKASRTRGYEEGKKQILDNIQNPETVKVTRVPEPETGDFNARKFLDTETM